MNIIVVHNGTITQLFANSEEDYIVIEGGTFRETTMREVRSLPVSRAEGHKQIELAGGYIAKYRDLYAKGGHNAYWIGDKENTSPLGDGKDMFSEFGKTVRPGSLLFQANMLAFLESLDEDQDAKAAYGL